MMKRRMFMGGFMAAIGSLFGVRAKCGAAPTIASEWPEGSGCGVASELKTAVPTPLPEGWIELRVYRVRKISSKLATVVESGHFPQAAIDAYPRLLTEDEYRQGWFNRDMYQVATLDSSIWDTLPYLETQGYSDGYRDCSDWITKTGISSTHIYSRAGMRLRSMDSKPIYAGSGELIATECRFFFSD